MPSVTFTAIKTATRAENDSIELVMTTKYSGDLSVTLTMECLNQLIAALATSESPPQGPLSTASTRGKMHHVTASDKSPSQARKVRSPKRINIEADIRQHDVVIVTFDAQSDSSTAYALAPAAAKQVAAGLVQKAQDVIDHAARRNTAPQASKD